MEWKALTSRSG